MQVSVKDLIAKFSGQSCIKKTEIGSTEQYLCSKDWQQKYAQLKDGWEQRCNNQSQTSSQVQRMIAFWRARGA